MRSIPRAGEEVETQTISDDAFINFTERNLRLKPTTCAVVGIHRTEEQLQLLQHVS